MRHKGSISEVQIERNKTIIDLYRKIKRELRHTSSIDICHEIALLPAKRFYISEERGYVIYLQWIMYGEVEVVSPHKKLLYLDFVSKCDQHQRNGQGIKEIVFEVLQMPAIVSGVSAKHIMRILHNANLKL